MSVWVCIPSKRSVSEVELFVAKWRSMGYMVALFRDAYDEPVACDLLRRGEYHGYAQAVNLLIKMVFDIDKECDWIVTGGDDTDPDPNKRADEIAAECSEHFGGYGVDHSMIEAVPILVPGAFGVMQPTGDRFCDGSIDRIAGSPWIGREFCERAYGGKGPYWYEYSHMFVDEEIMAVAQKLGVFWQRPDLTHLHHHYQRASTAIDSGTAPKPCPPHLIEANSPAHWKRSKEIFYNRKLNGFPGHEPMGMAATA